MSSTIPITLTKAEARLARDAAKLAGSDVLVGHGEQRLSRGDWCDLARNLECRAVDLEVCLELSTRRASLNLAMRIEAVLERWDATPRVEVEAVNPVPLGCLF